MHRRTSNLGEIEGGGGGGGAIFCCGGATGALAVLHDDPSDRAFG